MRGSPRSFRHTGWLCRYSECHDQRRRSCTTTHHHDGGTIMNDFPQVQPGWYPDPAQPGLQRYWDGAQWTAHTAPQAGAVAPAPYAGAASAPQPGGFTNPAHAVGTKKKGLSTGAIIGIVVGGLVLVLIVVGILAAIAIPIFLSQREKAIDSAARADVSTLGREIATYMVDSDPADLELTMNQDAYEFSSNRSAWGFVASEGVSLGGISVTSATEWCVWVYAPAGEIGAAQYSAQWGMQDGPCE